MVNGEARPGRRRRSLSILLVVVVVGLFLVAPSTGFQRPLPSTNNQRHGHTLLQKNRKYHRVDPLHRVVASEPSTSTTCRQATFFDFLQKDDVESERRKGVLVLLSVPLGKIDQRSIIFI